MQVSGVFDCDFVLNPFLEAKKVNELQRSLALANANERIIQFVRLPKTNFAGFGDTPV
jgi:hypothetical protein